MSGSSKIVLVDLGVGNSGSVVNAFTRLGCAISVARSAEELGQPDKLVLPGVGAFDPAIGRLDGAGLRAALTELVLGRGVPVIGICLGMQLLADSSDEGTRPGLGWIPGVAHHLTSAGAEPPPRVPHMGWGTLQVRRNSPLVSGLDESARFYFAHSYHLVCADPDDVLATTEYGGIGFTSAVARENVMGIQFHPEKSHRHGLELLRHFVKM